MKENHSAPGQVDLRDEICLAFRYLSLRGVTYDTFEKNYHISSKTLSKISAGKKISKYRKFYYSVFMKELDDIYQTTKDAEVTRVMAETGRVIAGLPHDDSIWQLIS